MRTDENFPLEYYPKEKEPESKKIGAASTWFSVDGDLDDFIFYGEIITDKSER